MVENLTTTKKFCLWKRGFEMAKKKKSAAKKKSRNSKYPWDRWFSQRSFNIERGKHFECQTHGMSQQIRNVAASRGVSVNIRCEDNKLRVKVG